ncbi:transposase [Nonomuraea aridisoli]|uniref:transposase n=1 Tax=Nonomuraea aridisoli TaxID=2070368 RepID=UPI001C645002|nr:transposase [Nonomuraea aridisoli]
MLSRFRNDVYACLKSWSDALFELADALLCELGPVHSPVDLTLSPEYRRGHGALYGGLNHGWINVERLRDVLAGLPLPDWRIVLAVDVSPWLCPDAACSAERLFCHVYGRTKSSSQFIRAGRTRSSRRWRWAAHRGRHRTQRHHRLQARASNHTDPGSRRTSRHFRATTSPAVSSTTTSQ